MFSLIALEFEVTHNIINILVAARSLPFKTINNSKNQSFIKLKCKFECKEQQTLPGCPISAAIRSKSPLMIISIVFWSHFWRFNFELPASQKPCQFSEHDCQLFFIINCNEFLLVHPPSTSLPPPSYSLSLFLLSLSFVRSLTPPLKYVLTPATVFLDCFCICNFLDYFCVDAITRLEMITGLLGSLSVLAPRVMSVYNKTKR